MDRIREIKGVDKDKGGDVYLYKKIERRARSQEENKVRLRLCFERVGGKGWEGCGKLEARAHRRGDVQALYMQG